jgi:hypothetical protein
MQRRSLAQEQLPKSRTPSALRLLPVLILRSALNGSEAAGRHRSPAWFNLFLLLALLCNAKCIDILRWVVVVETSPAPGLLHR